MFSFRYLGCHTKQKESKRLVGLVHRSGKVDSSDVPCRLILHSVGVLVHSLLLYNRVQDALFERRLDEMEDMEEIISVGPPLWELILQRELTLFVNQWVPHVTGKTHSWSTIRIV